MKVWKSRVKIGEVVEVQMPAYSNPVHFALQDGEPTMWFVFDDSCEARMQTRKFQVIATGESVPDGCIYASTLIDEAGFVWHLVEREVSRSECGVWIPFTHKENAEASLRFIRDTTRREMGGSVAGLDGWCLDDGNGAFGVFLPFADAPTAAAASGAVSRKFGLKAFAVACKTNIEKKTIAIDPDALAEIKSPATPGEVKFSAFDQFLSGIFKKKKEQE
jgi:hypothetical protein